MFGRPTKSNGRILLKRILIEHLSWITHPDFGPSTAVNLSPESRGGSEEEGGVDEELRVDEEITDEDEAGWKDPAMQPHHQHRWHGQPEPQNPLQQCIKVAGLLLGTMNLRNVAVHCSAVVLSTAFYIELQDQGRTLLSGDSQDMRHGDEEGRDGAPLEGGVV